MNNPALKEELTSPAHKAIMYMAQKDDGKGGPPEQDGQHPHYNNGDLDLTNTHGVGSGRRDISPTER